MVAILKVLVQVGSFMTLGYALVLFEPIFTRALRDVTRR